MFKCEKVCLRVSWLKTRTYHALINGGIMAGLILGSNSKVLSF